MKRYSRQIILPEIGIEGQERLKKASVLVIGAGGLGCPVIQYLASAGVGKLGILDYDIIEVSNLSRQPLFRMEDVGKSKAHVASQRALELNEELIVSTHNEKLTDQNSKQIISQYDIVADCCDNFSTRYIINDACMALDKAWVFGAIEGWQGQVSIFNFKIHDVRGPSYRTLFPQDDMDEKAPDCNSIGVIATLPAVVGSMQANELIKCITQSGKILSGRLLQMDLLNQEYHVITFGNLNVVTPKEKAILNSFIVDDIEVEYEDAIKRNFKFIDIRDFHEWEQDKIIEENIPYFELTAHPEYFKNSASYILVCDKGKRSQILALHLRKKLGQANIFSLVGGIESLRKLQNPQS